MIGIKGTDKMVAETMAALPEPRPLEGRAVKAAAHELMETAMRMAVIADRVESRVEDAQRRAAEARLDAAGTRMLLDEARVANEELGLRVAAAEERLGQSVHADGQVIQRLNDQLTLAQGDRDRAVAAERAALEDLGKVRSSFEAMRKAMADRLQLPDNATWPDILAKVG